MHADILQIKQQSLNELTMVTRRVPSMQMIRFLPLEQLRSTLVLFKGCLCCSCLILKWFFFNAFYFIYVCFFFTGNRISLGYPLFQNVFPILTSGSNKPQDNGCVEIFVFINKYEIIMISNLKLYIEHRTFF